MRDQIQLKLRAPVVLRSVRTPSRAAFDQVLLEKLMSFEETTHNLPQENETCTQIYIFHKNYIPTAKRNPSEPYPFIIMQKLSLEYVISLLWG